jgi:hypothetical protein
VLGLQQWSWLTKRLFLEMIPSLQQAAMAEHLKGKNPEERLAFVQAVSPLRNPEPKQENGSLEVLILNVSECWLLEESAAVILILR